MTTNARWQILFPYDGTIFIGVCLSLLFVFSQARRSELSTPVATIYGRAGEVLMVEKKMPAPPPMTPHSSSPPVDDSVARAKKRNPNVKEHIGRQLRALYDEVASQPVPDRFMELLDRLDMKSGEE
jgi:Anti-sigma factor NepR